MQLKLRLAFFLLAVSSPLKAQQNETSENNATMAEDTITTIDATEIDTPTDECKSWVGTLIASDTDSSNGLSESEYHTFLSSIEDPPYIAEYFRSIPSFDQLSWVCRAVHKSLACHCQSIGMGAGCCTGDDAEVLLVGLSGSLKNGGATTTTREGVDEGYVDFFCEQIAYAVAATLSNPNPTQSPPVSSSSIPLSLGSTTPSPVGGASHIPSVATKPVINATADATFDIIVDSSSKAINSSGVGTGGIVGICVAIFLAFISIIALISYRQKLVRSRMGKPVEDNGIEVEDIEASPQPQTMNKSGVITVHEQSSMDEGFETQVLPESNSASTDEMLALIGLVETSGSQNPYPSQLESVLSHLESELDSYSRLDSTLSYIESEPDASYIESALSYLESEPDPESQTPSYIESASSHYLASGMDPSDSEEEDKDAESESCESSTWSESDAGESTPTNNNYCSTLAAMGVASTITSKLMAPTPDSHR